MSKTPFMIDCPLCAEHEGIGRKLISVGIIIREFRGLFNGKPITYVDVCDKCGGSGRIVASMFNKISGNVTRKFTKRHRVEMQSWIAMEKELLYGKVERLE